MRRIGIVAVLLMAPFAAKADLILYEFNGTGDGWSIIADVVLDEADVVPGDLGSDILSWVFTWTNGADVFSSSSADNVLNLASFLIDASGLVAGGTDLCSSPCQVGNVESARIGAFGWSAGIPDSFASGSGAWSEARAVAVPEPGILALLGIGLAGLGFARRGKLIHAD